MASTKNIPKDAQVMQAILKDQGVTDYEPRLINQMLEFTYRYVTDVLDDAKVYASHASKKLMDADDVRLAVQCRMDHTFTNPPPRDLLLEIARQKNQQVLPLIKRFTGPKLPPDRYCLCSTNYKLKSSKKPRLHVTQQGLSSGSKISRPGAISGTPTIRTPSVSIIPRSMARPSLNIVPGRLSTPTTSLGPRLQLNTQGLIRTNMTSTPAPSVTVSVKRKFEDDDYDKP